MRPRPTPIHQLLDGIALALVIILVHRIEKTMGIILEPITLIWRSGPELNRFGDPFNFVATIIIDNEIAHIKGAAGTLPNIKEVRNLSSILRKQYAVKDIKWERLKNGDVKKVEVKNEFAFNSQIFTTLCSQRA